MVDHDTLRSQNSRSISVTVDITLHVRNGCDSFYDEDKVVFEEFSSPKGTAAGGGAVTGLASALDFRSGS